MPISSFRLKSTIGRNYKTDFDDTLHTKEALRHLGYYEEPPYGMTGYPDEALFSSIEKFQNDHGLRRDGIVKPGGETEVAIRSKYSSVETSGVEAPSNDDFPQQDNDRVAGVGAVVGPALRYAPALLAPFAEKFGKDLKRGVEREEDFRATNDNNRSTIANPVPPLPPQEQPPKIENETESPSDGPAVPTELINPIPSLHGPNIFIYPVPDNDLANFGGFVERRETGATKAEIDRVRDWFYETHDPNDWIQYGGRTLDGTDIPEYYHPSLAAEFVGGDGREGSRRSDLTFINKKTGQRIHIQTADVDKNGKVKQRELDAADDIRRFEQIRSKNPARPGTVHVYIIPKGAQLDKLRPIRSGR